MNIKNILKNLTSGFTNNNSIPLIPKESSKDTTITIDAISDSNKKINSTSDSDNLFFKVLSLSEIKKLSEMEISLLSNENLPTNPDELHDIKKYLKKKFKMSNFDLDSLLNIDESNKTNSEDNNIPKNTSILKNKEIKKNSPPTMFNSSKQPIISKSNNESVKNANSNNEENNNFSNPINKTSENGYYRKKANFKTNLLSAFVSYPSSPETLVSYINKNKFTIFINGIAHPNDKSQEAILCKKFLDENFKKKILYIEKLETLNSTSILANVFIDKEKTINIAEVAQKNGFATSSTKKISEDDLIIPEAKSQAKYSNPEDVHISKYSDQTITKNIESKEQKLQKELSPLDKYFLDNSKLAKEQNNYVGLFLESGKAPYLFEDGKSLSYFIKLKTQNKDIYLWGERLPQEISNSGAIPGDFIHLVKFQETTPKGKKFNNWALNLISDNIDNELHEKYLNDNKPLNESTTLPSSTDSKDKEETTYVEPTNNYQSEEKIAHPDIHSDSMNFLFGDDNPFVQAENEVKKLQNNKKNKP